MIQEVKEQIYNILTSDLGYLVVDNPQDNTNNTFPCLLLTTSKITRDKVKNTYQHKVSFKIDVFSTYHGEKEILEIDQQIYDTLQEKIYDNELVTYFRQTDFKVLDDNSVGVVMKHGIINYTVYLSGMEAETESE